MKKKSLRDILKIGICLNDTESGLNQKKTIVHLNMDIGSYDSDQDT